MRSRELAVLALAVLTACGARRGGAAAGAPPGVAGSSEVWAEHLVHPEATKILRAHLDSSAAGDVRVLTRAFYATHADEYDFLFLLPATLLSAKAAGRLVNASSAHRPWLNQPGPWHDPEYGSKGRLKAVVGLDAFPEANGPALHETLHHWGVFLDPSFGFGAGKGTRFGPHWGFSSVYGQLGGFQRASLACAGGAPLPCTAGADGRVAFELGTSFGPFANGGDTIPYAPLELYLMGLLDAGEVPSTLVLDDATLDGIVNDRIRLSAAGTHEVSVAALTARHGAVPKATQTEFRAAFVVVSEEALPREKLAVAERWARRLGGASDDPPGLSFEKATGGRARMSLRVSPKP